jgi:hypothetical protein
MKTLNFSTSACRVCRYFQPEGRRGGVCQQLSVPVRASWKACSLALPPFAPSWESIQGIWHKDKQMLKHALAVDYALDCSRPSVLEQKNSSTSSEELTAEILLV